MAPVNITPDSNVSESLKKAEAPTFNQPEPDDYLIDGRAFNKTFNISTSTRNRMKKDGRIPPPDIPGKNGSGDKWLHSTAMRCLAEMCQKGVV